MPTRPLRRGRTSQPRTPTIHHRKERSLATLTFPKFVRERKEVVHGQLLKIRAKRLRDGNLQAAIEAVCDLMVEEYRVGGKALTEESINGDIAEATVSLAMQIGLYKTNPGPWKGAPAVYRGGVKVHGVESFEFDLKVRLRKKLDRLLAHALEIEADRVLEPSIELAPTAQSA